jgi:hypothetical protein
MKNCLLILALIVSLPTFAQNGPPSGSAPGGGSSGKSSASSSETAGDANACKNAEKEFPAPYFNSQVTEKFFSGSDNFHECDQLSRGNLRKIYSSNGARSSKFDWTNYIEVWCKCNETKASGDCQIKMKEKARACESAAYVISFYDRNWDDGDQAQGTSSKSSAGGNANQQQQAKGTATNTAAGAAAAAQTLNCKSLGIETLDYEACVKFQEQLAIAEAVQTVANNVQQVTYQAKLSDIQTKYASETNTASAALKATGDSLKSQQEIYEEKTAMDTTKLAYMYSIYNEMPTFSDLASKCKNIGQKDAVGLGNISEQTCVDAMTPGKGGFAFTENQAQRNAMKTKLVAIATSAGSNTILAGLTGKRADDVQSALAKVDAYTATDPTTTTTDDATSTYCKENPGAAKCLTGGLDSTIDTINDNLITFGDTASGTSYSTSTAATSTASDSSASTSTASAVTPVGSVITAAAQDGSIEKSTAASVAEKGTGGANPGGGGGGASASSGSGANPQSAANTAAATVQAAVQGKTGKYEGGTGSISVVGGMGINKAKSEGKTDDNPFGKLFGKDGKANGSGVVNFREIASQKVGTQGDNLFDMISKRYSSVAADKRLLEYEMTK